MPSVKRLCQIVNAWLFGLLMGILVLTLESTGSRGRLCTDFADRPVIGTTCLLNLTPSRHDPCLYSSVVNTENSGQTSSTQAKVFVGMYVDDFVFYSTDPLRSSDSAPSWPNESQSISWEMSTTSWAPRLLRRNMMMAISQFTCASLPSLSLRRIVSEWTK